MKSRRRAFTPLKMRIVIAIIAVLIRMPLPALQKVREAPTRMAYPNNLRQLALKSARDFHSECKSSVLAWGRAVAIPTSPGASPLSTGRSGLGILPSTPSLSTACNDPRELIVEIVYQSAPPAPLIR